MKKLLAFSLFLLFFKLTAQENTNIFQTYPVFDGCQNETALKQESCFKNTFRSFFADNFILPEGYAKNQFSAEIALFFEVDSLGVFKLLYADAPSAPLKEEATRVFAKLPKVKPATYSGRPVFIQFSYTLKLPFESEIITGSQPEKANQFVKNAANEQKSLSLIPYENDEFTSHLNIPFSHQRYSLYDKALNQVGSNNHTASKPLSFYDVNRYFDIKSQVTSLYKPRNGWWGKKWWNERMVTIKSNDYWFTIDPVADLQLGADNSNVSYTYNNTRGIVVQGGLGKNFNFSASLFESQGRFAGYVNDFARSIRPDGGNPAIIPGRGIAKAFGDDAFDYPVAEGYIAYTPSKFVNFQLGHGRNFIGDGYRSLLLSDAASPYPYLKINTDFWKIRYTNIWMSLRDVRPEVTADGAFLTKYMGIHYLSWNVSEKLNLGLFETVIWNNDNNRGFDVNYLNPVIFYRFIEFSTGSRAGNALLGASAKYKWNNRFNLYGQLILDELAVDDILGGEKSWRNKFGYQLGAKYYDAFNIKDLNLQLEYNQVRPYTYSHNTVILNYAHNNQPMAHLWGSNLKELVAMANYTHGRWFGTARLIVGARGLDFNSADDTFAYGGDIFTNEENRNADTGIKTTQGNKTNVFIGDIQAGYLINPSTNLKVFVNFTYRSFSPQVETEFVQNNSTAWFNIGFRTDLFNWYFDF